MGTIWVKDFNGGLDTRRLPETTAGGVLLRARNGHINRGGEFEQRAAFVPEYELPSGTVGLFYDTAGLVVFGSGATPALPTGVSYQRLQHPGGTTELAGIRSADLYRGKIYVAAEFRDGSIYHFYDGTRVTDWYDGRASATFTIVSGSGTVDDVLVGGVSVIGAPVAWNMTATDTAADVAAEINATTSSPDYTATSSGPEVTIRAVDPGTGPNGFPVVVQTTTLLVSPASTSLSGGSAPTRAPGTFSVTGGGSGSGSRATTQFSVGRNTGAVALALAAGMLGLTLGGVNLISGFVPQGNNGAQFAVNVQAAINANSGTTGIEAYSTNGNTVFVRTTTNTAAKNGRSLVATMASGASFTAAGPFSGGSAAFNARFADVKVAGVSIIAAPVAWAGSNAATASALAAAINSHTSSPDYAATADGATVSLTAVVPSAVPDGAAVAFTLVDGMTVDPSSLVLPNTPVVYQPGNFVMTAGQKMYATSGSVMHFSGIREPTKWTTDAVGAGFIDMSEESSGAEDLTALARYQNYLAVFAERSIQIWYADPDPTLNRQVQVLNNTGTSSPKSVTSFGDTDIFYLDESGLRSLRARDSSNAAATTDIGIPVDSLVTEAMAVMDEDDRRSIIGLIEPVSGRFWLIMGARAYVFSYFPGSRISAWSEYTMEYTSDDEAQVQFAVTDAVAFRRRAYLRAGNQIFVYGGLTGDAYDASTAEAWLPRLDANEPAKVKPLTGLDAAVTGLWTVAAAMSIIDPNAEDKVAVLDRTTYDDGGRIPMAGRATHTSLRFRSSGVGPHKLAACVIHFEGDEKAG